MVPDPRPLPDAVELDLADECIETAAKRARRRLADELLRSPGPLPAVERRIVLLDEFLAATDFRALRAADETLAGGRPCRVRLERDPRGGVCWNKLP